MCRKMECPTRRAGLRRWWRYQGCETWANAIGLPSLEALDRMTNRAELNLEPLSFRSSTISHYIAA